jgi:glucose/arabinose dehydrogenase
MDTTSTQRGFVSLASLLLLAACSDTPSELEVSVAEQRAPSSVECAPDNGGITLPAGFCASVFADLTIDGEAARARHLVVLPNGDVFVAINSPRNQQPSFGIIGLRDSDRDGRADNETRFSPGLGGSGLTWGESTLYFGANDRVLRFRLPPGWMTPIGDAEVVVSGLVATGDHISKTVVLPDHRTLYVNIGSASNSCQEDNREVGSPGVFPCPELPIRAGVWRFDALGTDQTQADGVHHGTGLRNMVALAVNPADNELYGVQHGRDQLFEHWSEFFTVEEDAVLPAEELVRITEGSDNGWPYCYFDAVFENRKVLAPEYGGDGERVEGDQGIDCASYNQPLATFGAHWAPNGMVFYTGRQFPEKYRGGAFVAFHGGFDRAPLPNEGYQVAFVPFDGANADPDWETFADGFAGSSGPLPASAVHRPVGVAVGPDGSLYVSDDRGGRIWRIIFRGS